MEIDRIVQKGIDAGAFPGCQVVVAVQGKVIWRKAYGYHTYDNQEEVKNNLSVADFQINENLFICGDHLINGSINAAMKSGRLVSETIDKLWHCK